MLQMWSTGLAVGSRSNNVSYTREQRGHLPHQLRSDVLPLGAGWSEDARSGMRPGPFHRGSECAWLSRGRPRLVVADDRPLAIASFDWIHGTSETCASCSSRTTSFDAIYSPGVCEHFREGPNGVLTETRRVLRRGGIAVVSSPCFNEWLQRRAQRSLRDEPVDETTFTSTHSHLSGMAAVLEGSGFTCCRSSLCGARTL